MKALVVYDSGFGNTKAIAEAIAAGLSSLNAKVLPVGQLRPEDISSEDLLVVGSPINGWRPTQKTTEALSRLGKHGLSGVVLSALIRGSSCSSMGMRPRRSPKPCMAPEPALLPNQWPSTSREPKGPCLMERRPGQRRGVKNSWQLPKPMEPRGARDGKLA